MNFVVITDRILDGTNGNVAVDMYNRYQVIYIYIYREGVHFGRNDLFFFFLCIYIYIKNGCCWMHD